jgi:uncharacterized protein
MRSKALAALAFVAAAGAFAQAPGASAPAPADPMRLAEAKALVNSMHMDQTMGSAVTQGMSGMLAQMNPRRDPRIAKIAMEEAVAQMREDASRPGGMYDQLADFYASEFTVEEMKQIRAFQDSPVGKHLRSASPRLAQQMMQRNQNSNRDMLGRVCARVKARLASENVPDDVRCPAPMGNPSQPQYAPNPAPPPGYAPAPR